jgi:hypothetical protein
VVSGYIPSDIVVLALFNDAGKAMLLPCTGAVFVNALENKKSSEIAPRLNSYKKRKKHFFIFWVYFVQRNIPNMCNIRYVNI